MLPDKMSLPDAFADALQQQLANWQKAGATARIWARDAGVWTGQGEARWLGWLDAVTRARQELDELQDFSAAVCADGIRHVVLLGMGGSSMAPEVFQAVFGNQPGFPELRVLDSTDPSQLVTMERAVELSRTLFVVSSKSGSSLEPNILKDYFYQRMREVVGDARAGRHFVAITDPGTSLERLAKAEGFRHVFHGEPAIGGRFSALSVFGLVAAALIGVDCAGLLERSARMVDACRAPDVQRNPGVQLGMVLGVGALQGRDKLTLVIDPPLASIGAWLEQLVAESTGKQGKGIIPVDGEPLYAPQQYGNDRLFVYLGLTQAPDPARERAVAALEAAGQPVLRLQIAELADLGQEFFRWEFATAVAGALLAENPFDQPDVEASKIAARQITAAADAGQALQEPAPLVRDGNLSLFADPANAQALGDGDVPTLLHRHLRRLVPGDYIAVLAYMERNDANTAALQQLRELLGQDGRFANCLGYGPRFLHSTGQAYKGGPNTGVFVQITCDHPVDPPVPGHAYTFSFVQSAQANGDFEVLAERRRRLLRVHLHGDSAAALARLVSLLSGPGVTRL